MDVKQALIYTKITAAHLAAQHRLNYQDFVSYCHPRIPGLLARINPDLPDKAKKVYVIKSLRGYMRHCLRDEVNLIKTPRNHPPMQTTLIELEEDSENITRGEESDIAGIPEWALNCLESRKYGKRFANAYLRWVES